MNALRLEKMRVEFDLRMINRAIGRDKSIPKWHPKREKKRLLTDEHLKIQADIHAARGDILAKGMPIITVLDILPELYAVEEYLTKGTTKLAVGAVAKLIGHIERLAVPEDSQE